MSTVKVRLTIRPGEGEGPSAGAGRSQATPSIGVHTPACASSPPRCSSTTCSRSTRRCPSASHDNAPDMPFHSSCCSARALYDGSRSSVLTVDAYRAKVVKQRVRVEGAAAGVAVAGRDARLVARQAQVEMRARCDLDGVVCEQDGGRWQRVLREDASLCFAPRRCQVAHAVCFRIEQHQPCGEMSLRINFRSLAWPRAGGSWRTGDVGAAVAEGVQRLRVQFQRKYHERLSRAQQSHALRRVQHAHRALRPAPYDKVGRARFLQDQQDVPVHVHALLSLQFARAGAVVTAAPT